MELRHKRYEFIRLPIAFTFCFGRTDGAKSRKVQSFLNDLLEKSKTCGSKEFAELTAFAKELDGIDQLKNGTALIIRKN